MKTQRAFRPSVSDCGLESREVLNASGFAALAPHSLAAQRAAGTHMHHFNMPFVFGNGSGVLNRIIPSPSQFLSFSQTITPGGTGGTGSLGNLGLGFLNSAGLGSLNSIANNAGLTSLSSTLGSGLSSLGTSLSSTNSLLAGNGLNSSLGLTGNTLGNTLLNSRLPTLLFNTPSEISGNLGSFGLGNGLTLGNSPTGLSNSNGTPLFLSGTGVGFNGLNGVAGFTVNNGVMTMG